MKGISIVICCYNSASRLHPTLKHISLQKNISEQELELIIVDNNSSDNTAQIAIDIWQQLNSNFPIRIVKEPKPGLSFAREAGIKSSKFDNVIFCDDDNWLSEHYTSIALRHMNTDAEIGAVGGMGIGAPEITPPQWFSYCGEFYALGKQNAESGVVSNDRGFVYGAGMVLNKKAYEKVISHYTSALTDRKGKDLSSGGDTELCYLLRIGGYKILYDENLKFQHFIPADRLTWAYFERLFEGFAKANFYLDAFKLSLEYKNLATPLELYKESKKRVQANLKFRKRAIIKLFIQGVKKGDLNMIFTKYYMSLLKMHIFEKSRFLKYTAAVINSASRIKND